MSVISENKIDSTVMIKQRAKILDEEQCNIFTRLPAIRMWNTFYQGFSGCYISIQFAWYILCY